MHSLEPHIEHRTAQLQAEAEDRRLTELVPAKIRARPWVARRNRSLIGVAAAVSATLLIVAVAALGHDANTTPSGNALPAAVERSATRPTAQPTLHLGRAGTFVHR
jgi:hypothetical protein